MLIFTEQEKTHQVADRMIRDQKFDTDLEYKQICVDKSMNILQ